MKHDKLFRLISKKLDFVQFLASRSERGGRNFVVFLRANSCDVPIGEQKNNKIAAALSGDAVKNCIKSS